MSVLLQMKTHNWRELATPSRIKFVTLCCRAAGRGTLAKTVVSPWLMTWLSKHRSRRDASILHASHARTACRAKMSQLVIFCFSETALTPTPNQKHHAPIPPRLKRDVSADRHDTWSAGCDGRDEHVRRTLLVAHAKACGPGLPTLR